MDPNMNQYTQNNCCSHKSFGMLVEKPAAPTHTTLRRPNLSIDASQNPPIHSSNGLLSGTLDHIYPIQ